MAGEFDWIGQLIGGGINLFGQHDPVNYGNEAARMADPFASERSFYQPQLRGYMAANAINPAASTARTDSALAMLQGLLANPMSIRENPAYRAGLDFGLEGVNRGAGASGLINSGNR